MQEVPINDGIRIGVSARTLNHELITAADIAEGIGVYGRESCMILAGLASGLIDAGYRILAIDWDHTLSPYQCSNVQCVAPSSVLHLLFDSEELEGEAYASYLSDVLGGGLRLTDEEYLVLREDISKAFEQSPYQSLASFLTFYSALVMAEGQASRFIGPRERLLWKLEQFKLVEPRLSGESLASTDLLKSSLAVDLSVLPSDDVKRSLQALLLVKFLLGTRASGGSLRSVFLTNSAEELFPHERIVDGRVLSSVRRMLSWLKYAKKIGANFVISSLYPLELNPVAIAVAGTRIACYDALETLGDQRYDFKIDPGEAVLQRGAIREASVFSILRPTVSSRSTKVSTLPQTSSSMVLRSVVSYEVLRVISTYEHVTRISIMDHLATKYAPEDLKAVLRELVRGEYVAAMPAEIEGRRFTGLKLTERGEKFFEELVKEFAVSGERD